MNGISNGILFILWVALILLCWLTYHKLFDVTYFNLGKGLLKEIGTCGIIAFVLLIIVCYIWWVAAIIIAIIGINAFKKGATGVAILCGILVVTVIIVGIAF